MPCDSEVFNNHGYPKLAELCDVEWVASPVNESPVTAQVLVYYMTLSGYSPRTSTASSSKAVTHREHFASDSE